MVVLWVCCGWWLVLCVCCGWWLVAGGWCCGCAVAGIWWCGGNEEVLVVIVTWPLGGAEDGAVQQLPLWLSCR